jgi:hypothetical protein
MSALLCERCLSVRSTPTPFGQVPTFTVSSKASASTTLIALVTYYGGIGYKLIVRPTVKCSDCAGLSYWEGEDTP